MASAAYRPHTYKAAMAVVVGIAVLNTTIVASGEEGAEQLIQRILSLTTRSGIALRSIRHLEAATRSGKHHGWMDVETTLQPSGQFAWRVVSEGGSQRTREKVFRAVLQAESDTSQPGALDAAALSTANYIFTPVSTPAGGTRVRVQPRRADERLVDGTLTVDAEGHPLVLEGRLAKSPSFWVKSVTIVKRFSRIGGVSLPVSIESLADLRMFGQSTFTMHYRYLQVNGRSVPHTTASFPSFGPSNEIVALHTALRNE